MKNQSNIISLLKIGLSSILIGFLLFMMLQVAFAQILLDTILTASDSDSSLTLIIFLGFLLSSMVSFLTSFLVKESNKLRIFYAAVFALLLNLVLWISISYLLIIKSYPSIVQAPSEGSIIENIFERMFYYLAAIPTIISYFAIYILNSVITLWILALISYNVFFIIFLSKFGGV
jgi:hypothetical protein